MKKIIAILLLLSASVFSFAQYFEYEQKLACNDADKVLPILANQYGEQPIWYGNVDDKIKAVLTIGPRNLSWSFVLVAGDKACIVNTGSGYVYRPPVSSGNSI